MFRIIQNFLLKDIALEIRNIRSIQLLKNIFPGYLPWTGVSIHPTALVYLLNDITIHQRKHIVECGSGISTVYIGSLIKQMGLDITFNSIDHDENWVTILQQILVSNQLDEYVNLIHAPLKPCSECYQKGEEWYDLNKLQFLLNDSPPIDLLFIDGPPAKLSHLEHSRYPAVPVFYPNMANNYSIILDDISRKGEREIVKKWEKKFDLKFERKILSGNISIAQSGNLYNVL